MRRKPVRNAACLSASASALNRLARIFFKMSDL
jgi:hypothetical protein